MVGPPVKLSATDAKKLIKSHHYLLSTPYIVSLSYHDEKKGGQKTGNKVFYIGVIKKLTAQQTEAPDVLIPEFILFETEDNKIVNVPVVVIEEGEIVALSAPYKGGSMVYTEGVERGGTLGVNTQYKGTYRLLSAAHVLTRFNDNNIGKRIFARSDISEDYVYTGANVTGHVPVNLYDLPNDPNIIRAKQDLAWADITPAQGSPEIEQIGPVGSIRDPVLNEKVKCYGGLTEDLMTDMEIVSLSTSLRVNVDVGGMTKYAFFEDLVKIDLITASLLPGDSGSAAIAENDNKIVGIMMAATTFNGYFCKLTF